MLTVAGMQAPHAPLQHRVELRHRVSARASLLTGYVGFVKRHTLRHIKTASNLVGSAPVAPEDEDDNSQPVDTIRPLLFYLPTSPHSSASYTYAFRAISSTLLHDAITTTRKS